MFRLPPVWSPDSTKLLYADKETRLFYVDINEKKPVQIDQGKYADLTDYNWAPDRDGLPTPRPLRINTR